MADLPETIRSDFEEKWGAFQAALRERKIQTGAEEALYRDALRVFPCSDFVFRACERDPRLFEDLFRTGDLGRGRCAR